MKWRPSKLHTAVIGDCDNLTLESIIRHGNDVNAVDDAGNTALHLATRRPRSSARIISVLMRHNPDTSIVNKRRETAHFLAVRHGDLKSASLIVTGGRGFANFRDREYYERYYRLCQAIISPHRPCNSPRAILESLNREVRGDVDFARISHIETPLYFAVLRRDPYLVEGLLKLGAGPNPRRSILHKAIELNSWDCVQLLMDYGANPDVRDDWNNTTLIAAAMLPEATLVQRFSLFNVDPNVANADGQTALHTACRYSSPRSVEILLKYNALVDVKDKSGRTPLHHAAVRPLRSDCSGSKDDVIELLLLNGASVNVNTRDVYGRSPLELNCKWTCRALVLLLSYGSDEGYDVDFDCTCPDICEVLAYLGKMKLLGIQYNSLWITGNVVDSHLIRFLWQEELDRLKKVNLARMNATLFDVLLMKKEQVEKLVRDEILEKLYEDNQDDFENQFPHYGFLLNIRYREAQRKRELVMKAEYRFQYAMGKRMPYVVCKKIFSMLADSDLRSIVGENLPLRRIKKRVVPKDTYTGRRYCLFT